MQIYADVNWDVFDYKFSEKTRHAFQNLAHILFCYEHLNKSRIEVCPGSGPVPFQNTLDDAIVKSAIVPFHSAWFPKEKSCHEAGARMGPNCRSNIGVIYAPESEFFF